MPCAAFPCAETGQSQQQILFLLALRSTHLHLTPCWPGRWGCYWATEQHDVAKLLRTRLLRTLLPAHVHAVSPRPSPRSSTEAAMLLFCPDLGCDVSSGRSGCSRGSPWHSHSCTKKQALSLVARTRTRCGTRQCTHPGHLWSHHTSAGKTSRDKDQTLTRQKRQVQRPTMRRNGCNKAERLIACSVAMSVASHWA